MERSSGGKFAKVKRFSHTLSKQIKRSAKWLKVI